MESPVSQTFRLQHQIYHFTQKTNYIVNTALKYSLWRESKPQAQAQQICDNSHGLSWLQICAIFNTYKQY